MLRQSIVLDIVVDTTTSSEEEVYAQLTSMLHLSEDVHRYSVLYKVSNKREVIENVADVIVVVEVTVLDKLLLDPVFKLITDYLYENGSITNFDFVYGKMIRGKWEVLP